MHSIAAYCSHVTPQVAAAAALALLKCPQVLTWVELMATVSRAQLSPGMLEPCHVLPAWKLFCFLAETVYVYVRRLSKASAQDDTLASVAEEHWFHAHEHIQELTDDLLDRLLLQQGYNEGYA